ncbi:hypothetical protein BDZ94DRAFT_844434 [Collybia nuda]|uniref:Uncharacterized protein n=1 Tax=Collybia nuda TaxID=64659 RepID=A0A9P5YHW4_9AGAR|nr:hypothetical protein BDZ94DRAFT_844434 [Collybia nuda]
MEFAANEEASKGTILVASAEKSEEVVKVLQQCDPAVTEAPGEKSALPSPPPPIDEDAPVDQAATTPVVIPTVIKDMDIQARNLEVDVEVSHAEEDTRGLGSVLDAAEKDIATQMGEVSIEESSPVEEVVQVPQLVLHTGDDVTEVFVPSILNLNQNIMLTISFITPPTRNHPCYILRPSNSNKPRSALPHLHG